MQNIGLEILSKELSRNDKLKVIYKNTCPQANIEAGEIIIPPINGFSEEDIMKIRTFFYHESFHILYTTGKLTEGFQGEIENSLEDVRIERKGSEDYIGIRKSFEQSWEYWSKKLIEDEVEIDGVKIKREKNKYREALINMQLLSCGVKPKAILNDEVRELIDLCYDDYLKVRSAKNTDDVREIAKIIYGKMKHEFEKEKKEKDDDNKKGEKDKGKKKVKKSEGKGDRDNQENEEMNEDENSEENGEKKEDESDKDKTDEFENVMKQEKKNTKEDEIAKEIEKKVQERTDKGGYVSNTENDKIIIPDGDLREYVKMKEDIKGFINSLTHHLKQILKTLSLSRKHAYLHSGKIDWQRMVAIGKNLDKRVYYKEEEGIKLDTCVSILLDESGSMGSRIESYKLLAIALSEALAQIGIPFEIIGHTAYGSIPYDRRMIGHMRQIPIVLKQYKAFGETFNLVRGRLDAIRGSGENVDGEALGYICNRILTRREKRKVVFVLSDGEPASGENIDDQLSYHLKETIKENEKKGCEIYGFGIGTKSPGRYYKRFVYMEDLGKDDVLFFKSMAKILMNGYADCEVK